MRFVAIADTHSRHCHIKLPKGDVLVHAGDISYRGKKSEVEDFLKWFAKQNFRHKIFIAGNHDFFFEKEKPQAISAMLPEGVTYLNDNGITIEGIPIWGSPITPKFFNWAFNRTRGEGVRKHWNMIPPETQLLITHGPPYGILDQVVSEEHVGCRDLAEKVKTLKPQVHLFGHIHESYGTTKNSGIRFINASQTNENYDLTNRPIVFDL